MLSSNKNIPTAPFVHAAKAEQQKTTPLNAPGGKKRLLLVDDEEMLISVCTAFLQHLGYTVTAFTNSYEALEAVEQHPEDFDLLISDFNMPGLTGKKLAQKVYRIRPDLPIVICTGQKDFFPKQRPSDINLLKVIQKPDIFDDLTVTIHQHFIAAHEIDF